MTWVLDEQRRMLRDSAQTFLAERAPVSHLRALRATMAWRMVRAVGGGTP